MNKKGFAISVILYSIVFLIIAILYMLLGITRTRYTVNKGLRDNIIKELNEERSDLEYTSDETCYISGSDTYDPDLILSIIVSNYGESYKFDDGSWSSDNTISVDHAGIYIGYFKDTNGGIGVCSADVTSKTMYRYRDCASNDYIYSEYYNDNGTQKRDIIGCKFEKNEQWSNWTDTKPASSVTREIEARTSYKIK